MALTQSSTTIPPPLSSNKSHETAVSWHASVNDKENDPPARKKTDPHSNNSLSAVSDALSYPAKRSVSGTLSAQSRRPSLAIIRKGNTPVQRSFRLQPRTPDDEELGDAPITKAAELTGCATIEHFRENNEKSIPRDTEVVRASRSQLPSIPTSFFFKHQYIQVLDLSHNNLTALPEAIARLSQLRRLHIQFNQISELPASIATLRSLEVLTLSNNHLTHLDNSIGQLERLEILDISNNRLTTIPACLGFLVHTLSVFIVDGNPFEKYMADLLKPVFTKVYKRENSLFSWASRLKSSPLPTVGSRLNHGQPPTPTSPRASSSINRDTDQDSKSVQRTKSLTPNIFANKKSKFSAMLRRNKTQDYTTKQNVKNKGSMATINEPAQTTTSTADNDDDNNNKLVADNPSENNNRESVQCFDCKNYDIYSVEGLGTVILKSSLLDNKYTAEDLLGFGSIDSPKESKDAPNVDSRTRTKNDEDDDDNGDEIEDEADGYKCIGGSSCPEDAIEELPLPNTPVDANTDMGLSDNTINEDEPDPKGPNNDESNSAVKMGSKSKSLEPQMGDSHLKDDLNLLQKYKLSSLSQSGLGAPLSPRDLPSSPVFSSGPLSRPSITSAGSSTRYSTETSKSKSKGRRRQYNLPKPPPQQTTQLANVLYTLHDMWDVDPRNSEHEHVKMLTGCKVSRSMADGSYDISEYTRKIKNRPEERDHLLLEIVMSEYNYVGTLRDLITYFMIPMRENNVISAKEISTLFGNIETIYAFHVNHFHPALLECMATAGINSDANSRTLTRKEGAKAGAAEIGHVFLRFGPILKLYSHYSSNYQKALKLCHDVTERRSFANFLKKQKKENKMSNNRAPDLGSKLVAPIQRIPNYLLYLRRVLGLTPPEHPDHDNLCKALIEVTKQGNNVNERQREHEHRQLLYKLQNKIKGSQVVPLISPHRKYIKDTKFRLHLLVEPMNGTTATKDNNIDSDIDVSIDDMYKPPPKVRKFGPDVVYKYYLFSDIIIECTCVMDQDLTFNRVYKLNNRVLAAVVTPNRCLRIVHESGVIYLQGTSKDMVTWAQIINQRLYV